MMVDGVPSSTALTNPVQGFTIFPSIDLVQEFKVEGSSYSAEFGRGGGGIINLVYKSGTNQLHGSAFEFLRNSDLDANNFFSNSRGVSLPSFKRSQFGGSLSGPVICPSSTTAATKHSFFSDTKRCGSARGQSDCHGAHRFAARRRFQPDARRQRQHSGHLRSRHYSSVGSGICAPGLPEQRYSGSAFRPVAAKVVNYYPLPNAPGAAFTGANNYFVASTASNPITNYDAKIDENVNDRHRFFVRASRRRDETNLRLFPAEIRVAQGGVETLDTFINSAADYAYTYSPTFLVDLRLGYARSTEDRFPRSLGFSPLQLGLPAYMAGAQAFDVPWFSAGRIPVAG